MKRTVLAALAIAAAALASPAFADTSATTPATTPTLPATLIMPTALLEQLFGYLQQRPYGEVSGLVDHVKACILAQQQPAAGAQCPEVLSAAHAHVPTPPPAVAVPPSP